MKMLIAIRTDATIEIGSGHVMRCLALADRLRKDGAEIRFICREAPGHMAEPIAAQGHGVFLLPAAERRNPADGGAREGAHPYAWAGSAWQRDAEASVEALRGIRPDWLIVDHYAIDGRWHGAVRPSVERIMVIDDLADRPHDCDLLLDQSFGRTERDYQALVPRECRFLVGSRYALLRPEFEEARDLALGKRKSYAGIRRILVSMGSVDAGGFTGRILTMLGRRAWKDGAPAVDVVLGPQAPHLMEVRAQIEVHPLRTELHVGAGNMAELMTAADVSIGAGGTTSWERCALALPSLIAIVAENQRLVTVKLEEAGAVRAWLDMEGLELALDGLAGSGPQWMKMQEAAAAICDGRGCGRVAEELIVHAVR